MGCIFCAIVRGDAPCHKIHEDELTMTFLDLFPVARGHTLIVPREHCDNLYEARPEALSRVATNSIRFANAIKSTLAPDGLSVFQLNGAAAGQTVFHYHMHLIPRKEGDTLAIHSRIRGSDSDLTTVATLLRAELEKD